MSGFKLLAIRPLEGCDKKYLKNLKEGMLYKFYEDYIFYVKDKEKNQKIELTTLNFEKYKGEPICKIDTPNETIDLYSQKKLNINISAIVGKNGSGKSSLVELLYKYLFELSIKILRKDNHSGTNELCIDIDSELKRLSQESMNISKASLNPSKKYRPIEIEEELARITQLEDIEYQIKKLHEIQKEYQQKLNLDNIELCYELNGQVEVYRPNSNNKFPFYNISINHSAYSLNSEIVGNWIEKIFHKNDGYQTPIVLNPMRTFGNIDINNENHLNKSRLLLNMDVTHIFEKQIESIEFARFFEDETDAKEFNSFFNLIYSDTIFLIEDNVFHAIKVKRTKIEGKQKNIDVQKIENSLIEFSEKIHEFFPEILKLPKFNLANFPSTITDENEKKLTIKVHLFRYLQFKFIKYAKFNKLSIQTNNGQMVKEFNQLLIKFNTDTTHQTFKIFQILHLLKENNINNFVKLMTETSLNLNEIKFSITSDSFKEYLNKFEFLTGLKNTQEVFKVPAAFFSVNFKFKNESYYEHLSSGEIQVLNSINQVTYHLRNIESITDSYENINIIFDEVELYFHVDYQRTFIANLLKAIDLIKLKRIKNINVLFLTHSPFILSDIPAQNILRLEKGEPSNNEFKQTFGANIHNLLANDFFLKNGFMGEFAKGEINEIITFLNHEQIEQKLSSLNEEKDKVEISKLEKQKNELETKSSELTLDNCQAIILLVGEPVIRETLLRQYYGIISTNEKRTNSFFEHLAKELNYNISKKK